MSSEPKIQWLWVRAARYGCVRFAMPLMLFSAGVALDPLALGMPGAKAETPSLSQSSPQRAASTKEIRRLQRLLKLLANQNPARYASVDPGVIDGTLGPGTVSAVRKFQRIIGVRQNPVITPNLYTQILTAQSERPSPDFSAKSDTPKRKTAATAPRRGGNKKMTRFAQLSSLKDEKRIPEEWARLEQLNPDLLKGRKPVVETATLGQRGTYYRILVGPFDNFQSADAFCGAWRKQRQSCLVKKRLATAQPRREDRKPITAQVQSGPDRTKTTPPIKVPDPAVTAKANNEKTTAAANLALNAPAATSDKQVNKLDLDTPVPHSAPLSPVEQSPIDPPPATSEPPLAAVILPTSPSVPSGPPDTERQPQQEIAKDKDATPPPAIAADKTTSADKTTQPTVAPATALAQWMARIDRIGIQSYLGPAVAALAGTCFGLLVVVWRQRRRKNLMFESILVDPWYEGGEHGDSERGDGERGDGEQPPISQPIDILEELKIQFDGADLVECRKIRDAFLESVKEPRESLSPDTETSEYAMLVNRKLNQMLASEPSRYKSVFLNWIFLNHAAESIESSQYSLKRLDPRIQAEFRLLASLFKIHLLELEARHHVRERLPNIFATLHQLES